jgi:glycosyltransferase involved in cell wall biosynthesis
MIVVFISARSYEQDFRKFLLDALRADGHEAWHVKVGRCNTLTGADGIETFDGIAGLLRLIRRLRAIGARGPVVYVDTTGAIMPVRSLLFRLGLRTGTWCFDVYDNLVYNYRGVRLLKTHVSLWLLSRLSQITILLSRESLRLFPAAYHLDNAWDIPRQDCDFVACRDLVVLSAIDGRFDFDFLGEVAGLLPDRRIAIHGYILHDDPSVKQRMADLCAQHRNVTFEGRYAFDDIPEIVRPFAIGLTPYAAGTPMTEFINPDKYYLFLQAGLEVISTDIPQARRMADRLHVARAPRDVAEIARRIEREPAFRKNAEVVSDFTWRRRARDFSEILRAADRRPGHRSARSALSEHARRSVQPDRSCP